MQNKRTNWDLEWGTAICFTLIIHFTSVASSQSTLCIEALAGDQRISTGIATALPEETVYVKECQGDWSRLNFVNGRVKLSSGRPDYLEDTDTSKLPDAEITGSGSIPFTAWLGGPTQRYGHGILGDTIEASAINIRLKNGDMANLELKGQAVFEDLRVRLVDLNADGRTEIVTIRSDVNSGAALDIYQLKETGITPLASTPPIGQGYRWLNPAGAADFDGDGTIEIAYIETPHIGGILKVYSLVGSQLKLEHSEYGFSNHAMGSRNLDMAAVIDWNGDGVADLAIPDTSRRHLKIVTLRDHEFRIIETVMNKAQISTAILASDLDGDGKAELVYGLSDGTLKVITP